MAAGVWVASVPLPHRLAPIPFPAAAAASFLAPALTHQRPRRHSLAVCFVLGERVQDVSPPEETVEPAADAGGELPAAARLAEKVARKRSERYTYLVAAVMSSFGITSMAVAAVYYRFYWQFEASSSFFSVFMSAIAFISFPNLNVVLVMAGRNPNLGDVRNLRSLRRRRRMYSSKKALIIA